MEKDLEEAQGSTIIDLERELTAPLPVEGPGVVLLSGRLDRMEQGPEGGIHVLDYKTGAPRKGPDPGGLDSLEEALRDPDRSLREALLEAGLGLQMPLYAYLVKEVLGRAPHGLWLVSLRGRRPGRVRFLPPGEASSRMESLFIPLLSRLVREILSPEVPFEAEPAPDACRYCGFRRGPCRPVS